MEFLAPVFAVAGIAAAGVPLVLHMLRRTPTERLPFSLVRFLKPSRPRFTRRSTVEHWPLLLLRILAVMLLGLAFARPFQRSIEPGLLDAPTGRSTTLLIDRSASMRRDGLRDAVVSEVQSIVQSLDDSDPLQVVLFSDTAETVLEFNEWAALSDGERVAAIDQLCAGYAADWQATQTGRALLQTADDLVQDAGLLSEHHIILITDFQEGSDFAPLHSADWPASVSVSLRLISAEDVGNAALRTMEDRRTGRALVRISNSADSATTRYRIQPQTSSGLSAGPEIPVDVLPGRQVSLPLDQLTSSAEADRLILTGDDHDFDNHTPLPRQQPRLTRVAHVGSTDMNNADDMRYYLQRAVDGLMPAGDEQLPGKADISIVDAVTSEGLVLPIESDIELAILTDAAPAELLPSLSALLARGGVVVAALRSTLMAESIGQLLPDGVSVTEASVDDYAMLGQIDFEHPLFARFSDARFADFSSIRFWHHRSIALNPPTDGSADHPAPWTVVARFDSGLPAIVRLQTDGPGSLYLLASGWHPEDSQWALSSRFAPMLAGFRQLARPPSSETRHIQVGDILNPAESARSDKWELRLPDGTTLTSDDSDSRSDTVRQIRIDQPGVWQLTGTTDDQTTQMTLLAQLAPEESLTTALPEGQLYAMHLADASSSLEQTEQVSLSPQPPQASGEQLEAKQKYWRWFLLAGLSCLVLEALLAAVIHRRQLPESVG